jgi:hypothetical protein
MYRTVFCVTCLLSLSSSASAQWPARTTPELPRSADGKVSLTAPAPRTSRGTPDLSGLWIPEPDPNGRPEGVENTVFPRYLMNVAQDVRNPTGVLIPAAESLYRERLATDGVDDPIAHCQPPGSPRMFSLPKPTKIVETPGLTLLLHEHDTTYRQIFTDGRPLPEDPFPTWMGYSIGRWDHDMFVVTTSGVTDRSWLDVAGHPHTEALVMTERFRRVDVGHMDIEVTYTDPGTFETALTIMQKLRLLPDQEIIEYFCSDNEKDQHRYFTEKMLKGEVRR